MLQDVSEEMHQPDQLPVEGQSVDKDSQNGSESDVKNGEVKDQEQDNKGGEKNQGVGEGQIEASVSLLPDQATTAMVVSAAAAAAAVVDVVCQPHSGGQDKDKDNDQEGDKDQDQHQNQGKTQCQMDGGQLDGGHMDGGHMEGGGDGEYDSGTEKESDSGTMVDDGN